MDQIKNSIMKKPIIICISLFLIAFVFRIADIFFLQIEDAWGEIAVSKICVILLILTFLYLAGKGIDNIGFHFNDLRFNMMIGLVPIIVAFTIAYSLEFLYLLVKGYNPVLRFIPMGHSLNAEWAVTGGLVLAFWLVMGNIVNSFAEEGLFRGVMLPLLGSKITLTKANLFQALLFGLWHIAWPIKSVLDGQMDIFNASLISLGYILLATLIGYTWGMIYIQTNSLWGSWFAHTFNNTVLNFVHMQTVTGVNELLNLRVILISLTFFILVLIMKKKLINTEKIEVWDNQIFFISVVKFNGKQRLTERIWLCTFGTSQTRRTLYDIS